MPVVFSSTWSESIVLRILALTLGLVGLVERTSSVQAQSVYFSATTWGRGHYGQGPAGFGCHRYDSPFLCGYGYVGGSVVASFGGRSINPGAIGYPSYDAWQHIVYGVPIQMIPTDPVAYVYGYAASGALPDPRLGYFTNSTLLAPHGLSVSVTPLQTSATRLLKPDFADGLGYAQPLPNSLDSSRRPVTPSTTAARLRSRERQSIGDEHFRKHQWAKAYIEYRAAVDAAPDRAESHHRLGFVLIAMQHYASAVGEFKSSILYDPALPKTGEKLISLLGPESQILRAAITQKVADWLRKDLRHPDRLFLFGLVLHDQDDARESEVFEAAQRMAINSGRSADHIVAFLKSPASNSVKAPAVSESDPIPARVDLPIPNDKLTGLAGSLRVVVQSPNTPTTRLLERILSETEPHPLPSLSTEPTPPRGALIPPK